MDTNIYLNAIVFYRLAQRDQKQKVVPDPEFQRFDLTYFAGAPGEARLYAKHQPAPRGAAQSVRRSPGLRAGGRTCCHLTGALNNMKN